MLMKILSICHDERLTCSQIEEMVVFKIYAIFAVQEKHLPKITGVT